MAEEGEFAGLEEPWAVIHKATIHTLIAERNKDAAPKARTRRTHTQLYQVIQNVVQRIVTARWVSAHAASWKDEGQREARFRKLWEAPGVAVITRDESDARVVLFMRSETRARWRRSAASAREFRTQQYAPPQAGLPAGTVTIYTTGTADSRKPGNFFPPAGYGAVAVTGGRGMEHHGGARVTQFGEPVTSATKNVRTTTTNLCSLVAFTRALQWARRNTTGPICIRYSEEYAARVASGAWKAKKHKAMAAEARAAWIALRRERGSDKVWMKHAPVTSSWMDEAWQLALRGKQGAAVRPAGGITVD